MSTIKTGTFETESEIKSAVAKGLKIVVEFANCESAGGIAYAVASIESARKVWAAFRGAWEMVNITEHTSATDLNESNQIYRGWN